MTYSIITDDVLSASPDGLFHAVLCDPPYEIGFMGKQWDRSGVAFSPETWCRIGEFLHPGGFLMAFSSSRGWHRLCCAIEDAGFIIHSSLFGWSFGSGFPKATRIDTQIDREAGVEREVVGVNENIKGRKDGAGWGVDSPWKERVRNGEYDPSLVTAPALPLSRAWEGHRYGLQAIKPSVEPIIVAQKPYKGKPYKCIAETGAGALWIDGARIGTDRTIRPIKQKREQRVGFIKNGEIEETGSTCGRWPANLILLDEGAALRLDEQSGFIQSRVTGKPSIGLKSSSAFAGSIKKIGTCGIGYTDSGGASRFFYQVQNQLDEADPIYYCSKASRKERDAGCEGLPIGRSVSMNRKCVSCGKGQLDGRREGQCCDSPNFSEDVPRGDVKNHHPTVKPIDLARYLSTLLLPPKEYAPRRLLGAFFWRRIGDDRRFAFRMGGSSWNRKKC